ncbi:conserved protein [Tepidicaulis marinus]|uniref:Conserved protein n=1 Tax=Tepidicaulis marinus TaxID=1333998 RepID=A0A081BDQ6_9HYPH|nr:class I SAM-dependent methyltransferase [Tepidicaulis marinus]GAK46174.1 conserved protein [Tepidicaulis marinus]
MLTYGAFQKVYEEALSSLIRHLTPEMQVEISRHCASWHPKVFDFNEYLSRSGIRAYYAYKALIESGGGDSVCDIGGFVGVFPVTLAKLGMKAFMTEALKYYGSAFTPLFEEIGKSGVEVIDYDPFEAPFDGDKKFDFITCMAVLEHYPHSPLPALRRLTGMVSESGRLYFEVPNICYWPKRVDMLFGKSPLPNINEVISSDVPFVGHHREYSQADLRALMEAADLEIISERAYNYSQPPDSRPRWRKLAGAVRYPGRTFFSTMQNVMSRTVPSSRETISCTVRPIAAS